MAWGEMGEMESPYPSSSSPASEPYGSAPDPTAAYEPPSPPQDEPRGDDPQFFYASLKEKIMNADSLMVLLGHNNDRLEEKSRRYAMIEAKYVELEEKYRTLLLEHIQQSEFVEETVGKLKSVGDGYDEARLKAEALESHNRQLEEDNKNLRVDLAQVKANRQYENLCVRLKSEFKKAKEEHKKSQAALECKLGDSRKKYERLLRHAIIFGERAASNRGLNHAQSKFLEKLRRESIAEEIHESDEEEQPKSDDLVYPPSCLSVDSGLSSNLGSPPLTMELCSESTLANITQIYSNESKSSEEEEIPDKRIEDILKECIFAFDPLSPMPEFDDNSTSDPVEILAKPMVKNDEAGRNGKSPNRRGKNKVPNISIGGGDSLHQNVPRRRTRSSKMLIDAIQNSLNQVNYNESNILVRDCDSPSRNVSSIDVENSSKPTSSSILDTDRDAYRILNEPHYTDDDSNPKCTKSNNRKDVVLGRRFKNRTKKVNCSSDPNISVGGGDSPPHNVPRRKTRSSKMWIDAIENSQNHENCSDSNTFVEGGDSPSQKAAIGKSRSTKTPIRAKNPSKPPSSIFDADISGPKNNILNDGSNSELSNANDSEDIELSRKLKMSKHSGNSSKCRTELAADCVRSSIESNISTDGCDSLSQNISRGRTRSSRMRIDSIQNSPNRENYNESNNISGVSDSPSQKVTRGKSISSKISIRARKTSKPPSNVDSDISGPDSDALQISTKTDTIKDECNSECVDANDFDNIELPRKLKRCKGIGNVSKRRAKSIESNISADDDDLPPQKVFRLNTRSSIESPVDALDNDSILNEDRLKAKIAVGDLKTNFSDPPRTFKRPLCKITLSKRPSELIKSPNAIDNPTSEKESKPKVSNAKKIDAKPKKSKESSSEERTAVSYDDLDETNLDEKPERSVQWIIDNYQNCSVPLKAVNPKDADRSADICRLLVDYLTLRSVTRESMRELTERIGADAHEVVLAHAIVSFLGEDRPCPKAAANPLPDVALLPPDVPYAHMACLCYMDHVRKDPPAYLRGDIFELVMRAIEHALFNLARAHAQPKALTRFYATLCHVTRQTDRLRVFCADALYCMKFRALAVIETAVAAWGFLFPKASYAWGSDPLAVAMTYVAVCLCNASTGESNLKALLFNRYGYNYRDHNDTTVLQILVDHMKAITATSKTESLKAAFYLLAKHAGPAFCYSKIFMGAIMRLMEDPGVDVCAKCFAIRLIGPLAKPFPDAMRLQCEIIVKKLLFDLKSGAGCHSIEESLIYSLSFFVIKNRQIVKDIYEWKPREAVDPELLDLLERMIKKRRNQLKMGKFTHQNNVQRGKWR